MITKVTTKDGSFTYHNSKYDEHYHSLTGAEEEAIKKYAEPCKISLRKNVRILDVCFGLGYNSAAAIDAFRGDKISIVGLEIDPEIITKISELPSNFKCYPKLLSLVDLRMGDARETIKGLEKGFDVVFFDPFSPKKCPELWTFEFFKSIFDLMNPGGILATYSCARVVRENLLKAGFKVSDGPIVGRWAPGTLATV